MIRSFFILIALLSSYCAIAQYRYWPVLGNWKSDAEAAYCAKSYATCVVAYDTMIAQNKPYFSREALFNQAACAAKAGDTARAFECLTRITDKNYQAVEHLSDNADFASLYNSPTWQKIMARTTQNRDRFEQYYHLTLPQVRHQLLAMYDESQKFQQWSFYRHNYAGMYAEYSEAQLLELKNATFRTQFDTLIQLSKNNGGTVFGKSKVGVDGAQAFVVLVINANHDPTAQDAFTRAIEESDSTEFLAGDVAILTDKRLVHSGLPQRFGTVITIDASTGKPVAPLVVEDPAQLNARRKAIDLEPLDESWFK